MDSTFKTAQIMLKLDESLFMYTDGVPEAFNKDEEVFSEARLMNELSHHRQASSRELVLSILRKITVFAGDMPRAGDIAILALKYVSKKA